MIRESDPLRVKGILGACEGTIGSRYHGLVSALSQGVPSLGAGWSHKYLALFEDYGFPEGLLDVTEGAETFRKLDMILEPASGAGIRETIKEHSARQKRLSMRMWEDVFAIIGGDRETGVRGAGNAREPSISMCAER